MLLSSFQYHQSFHTTQDTPKLMEQAFVLWILGIFVNVTQLYQIQQGHSREITMSYCLSPFF